MTRLQLHAALLGAGVSLLGMVIGLAVAGHAFGATLDLGDCPTVAAVPAPKAHHHAIDRRVAFHRRHAPVCHCGDALGGPEGIEVNGGESFNGGSGDALVNFASGDLGADGGGASGGGSPGYLRNIGWVSVYSRGDLSWDLSPGGPLPGAAATPEAPVSVLLTIGFGALGLVAYRRAA